MSTTGSSRTCEACSACGFMTSAPACGPPDVRAPGRVHHRAGRGGCELTRLRCPRDDQRDGPRAAITDGPMAGEGELPVKPILGSTVAMVTGASSGIGAATATALVLESDITDERQATDAVERTVAELGRLDTLVNNAGVMLLGPAAGAPLTEWQRMVELNVLGLLYCAHAAMPHLLRAAEDSPRQVADMVNISSVAGRVARNGSGVYNLTKHGVGAFSESLRQELTRRYVRVSLVEPGATATELAEHNRPEVLEGLRNQFGQRMEAEDIADAITYIVTRPRHVAVNEMLIRPTEQER